jgi:Arc/MetJ-type ribon-helix-helix transcriptional regulator
MPTAPAGLFPGTTVSDTVLMSSAKIVISLDPKILRQVDRIVESGLFPSRDRLIQNAVAEKLQHLRRARLAQECAKLQVSVERAAAEEFFQGEAEWPSIVGMS